MKEIGAEVEIERVRRVGMAQEGGRGIVILKSIEQNR